MKRPRKLTLLKFLPYYRARTEQPAADEMWIDVSSDGDEPFNQLSPFYPHGKIPVPGMNGETSDSVEGIWQGLKVIRGKTAPRFFEGFGRKRGGKPEGHQFGDQKRLLSLVEAREKIYRPAYFWMLENCIAGELTEMFISRAFQGVPQSLYDREDNGSLHRDQPLAHAILLVQWLNEKINASLD